MRRCQKPGFWKKLGFPLQTPGFLKKPGFSSHSRTPLLERRADWGERFFEHMLF
jgi:hypothetical protein